MLSKKDKWYEYLIKLKKFLIIHKKRPQINDKNTEIKCLAYWLINQICSYNGKTRLMSKQEIYDAWSEVINDPQLYVLFAAKSMSGNGIKALLFLKDIMFLRDNWPWQNYKATYYQITDLLDRYCRETYGIKEIDTQMKAISQPLYLFHSPELFVHQNLQSWI